MIPEDFVPGGLHPKSETDDKASPAPRWLTIEWTARSNDQEQEQPRQTDGLVNP